MVGLEGFTFMTIDILQFFEKSANPYRLLLFNQYLFVQFEHDTVLVPRETSWFGYYKDGAFNSTIPPQQVSS